MIEGLKFSVLRRSELNAVLRFGPECRDRKSMFARRHELHRPAESAGCDRDNRGPLSQGTLGAEGGAHIATHNPDLTGLDAKLGCEPVLDPIDILARLVDRQLRAIPDALGGEQFDRIVMLGRR